MTVSVDDLKTLGACELAMLVIGRWEVGRQHLVLYALAELASSGLVRRTSVETGACPGCSLSLAWDGFRCGHCNPFALGVLPRRRLTLFEPWGLPPSSDLPPGSDAVYDALHVIEPRGYRGQNEDGVVLERLFASVDEARGSAPGIGPTVRDSLLERGLYRSVAKKFLIFDYTEIEESPRGTELRQLARRELAALEAQLPLGRGAEPQVVADQIARLGALTLLSPRLYGSLRDLAVAGGEDEDWRTEFMKDLLESLPTVFDLADLVSSTVFAPSDSSEAGGGSDGGGSDGGGGDGG